MNKSYEHVGENKKCGGRKTSIQILLQYERRREVCFGSVNMTSNDLLHVQVDVENYFQCFYCILFKNSTKKAI